MNLFFTSKNKGVERGSGTKKDEQHVQELVVRSQNADSGAFGDLYDLYIDQIFRYISFRVSEDENEDLTELVFLKAWEKIREYKPGTALFSSWLFRIAHNCIVDYYRVTKTNREQQQSLTENVPETRRDFAAENRIHRRIEREVIKDALDALPEDYKSILVLRYINDLEYEEIEHILQRGYSALRILQYRALKALKKELSRLGYSESDL